MCTAIERRYRVKFVRDTGRKLIFMLIPLPDRWCLHSYYSLCPYAPDGSDRILLAGADLTVSHFERVIVRVKELARDGGTAETVWLNEKD